MRTQFLATAAVLAAGCSFVPAMAQSTEDSWTGFYVGGSVGATVQPNDQGSSILFDTNQDGDFNNVVNTSGGANAFSPGFCNGAATSTAPTACRNDKDGIEYFGHVGFDKQMGNFVLGAVGEFGKNDIRDSVSGFSTTPASYTLTRSLKYSAGLRLRAGYTPNGKTLFYATGGGAYGKVRNSFSTTNTANSFTDNGNSDAWGWTAGGGVDQKIGSNFSIGLQYLYTNLNNDDYVVRAGPGTAPPTNPFLLVNSSGTDMQRSDDKFRYHSIRATASFRF
ncbi:outer membrane protein [Sphingomonas colocasiae]|uniref:Outer membrane beta-barrel protein n=1 Tax=Sphingomonas colocasiae TaxID=1848973 RepID=A0ABS7PNB5_9SPHN|nr:outer membrane beta-barrel protein [Sphingomonas colocasiae]MBY8822721.1 outer membrane beta-barrel protein [Sphingomonas colocasiae]